MKLRVARLAILAAAVIACSDDDGGNTGPAPETFSAVLTGAAERPNPAATTATGTASFTFRNDTMYYTVTATGLTGPATLSHIHGPADATVAVGIAHGFAINAGVISGTVATGLFTVPSNVNISRDSILKLMRTNLSYVNVHTALFPGGEIRGQIVKP